MSWQTSAEQKQRLGVAALIISGLSGLTGVWLLAGTSQDVRFSFKRAVQRCRRLVSATAQHNARRRPTSLGFLAGGVNAVLAARTMPPPAATAARTDIMADERRSSSPAVKVLEPKTEAASTHTTKDGPTSRSWWAVLKLAFTNFSAHKIPQLGASMAYYTVFSLAPLLLLSIAIASLVFGEEAVNGQVALQMEQLLGEKTAEALQAMITSARSTEGGSVATVFGVVLLLLGASGVFVQLQDALNTIWEVPAKVSGGVWGYLRDRGLSFAMVLVIGFLLLVSLLVSTAIAALQTWLGDLIPGPDFVVHLINLVASMAIITLLFAVIFKFLPDAKVAWSDVWVGALVTSALFTVGKFAIGLYLGHGAVSSAYGAAGSLVVILVWTYYSSQILLFGAEFTQARARLRGTRRQ